MFVFMWLTVVYAYSLFARFIPVMISRFVLSIRKVGNQKAGVSEWTSHHLSFAPSDELPVSTQTHTDLSNLHPSGASCSHDIR